MVNFRDGATPGLHPISAKLFRRFFVKLPQNRHPERSASQIDSVTQRLWRGVEGPRRCFLTHAARSFSATEAGKQQDASKFVVLGFRERPCRARPVRARWLKSSEQHG